MITYSLRALVRNQSLEWTSKRLLLSLLMTGLVACSNISPIDNNNETPTPAPQADNNQSSKPECTATNTVKAEVVALEQVYFYNRFGAFNPNGMIYALRRDVVENFDDDDSSSSENKERSQESEKPLKPFDRKDQAYDRKLAGNVKLHADKRPRPLVLRVNEGDCLEVTFTNLLAPGPDGQSVYQRDPKTGLFNVEGQEAAIKDPELGQVLVVDGEDPTTRHASMHVNGLNYIAVEGDALAGIMSDGSNVGRNSPPKTQTPNTGFNVCSSVVSDFGKDKCSLAAPGETRVYRWYAKKEGGYLFYSMGGPAGGEGDGGQLGLGLFGSINVQPKGAKWYRSQVTEAELTQATKGKTKFDQPIIDYEATFQSGANKGDPVLNMLKCEDGKTRKNCEIIYSDLNAVVDIGLGDTKEHSCQQQGEGGSCNKPYREFTAIFHDELTAIQAFKDLSDEDEPIAKLKDGMGVNYGAAGVGSMVLANRKKVGPGANCPECKLEEFFLTSWVNGDPALVLGSRKDDSGEPVMKDGKVVLEAKYPSDPSNVHHSYLGDPIRFRNMHAGPKETHVFHLHAHQWLQDKADPNSVYLDSQTISPGAVFSYEIQYGGSGNRNLAPGDSIFHCHLYPHFAQGMWELWRSHDVFETGKKGLYDPKKPISAQNHPSMRNLPDAEIADGTPNPAIVPLPRTPLPPMPSEEFRGYPFYIAGEVGHRPPQPPLDLAHANDSGTLQRHIITDGSVKKSVEMVDIMSTPPAAPSCNAAQVVGEDLYSKGRRDSACIAKSVRNQNDDIRFTVLARELDVVNILSLPHEGTSDEKTAMAFHEGELVINGSKAVDKNDPKWKPSQYNFDARGYPTCQLSGSSESTTPFAKCDDLNESNDRNSERVLFRVNGRAPKPGAPYADPCPENYVDASGNKYAMQTREYKAAYIQFDMQVNKEGWHDPQARIAILESDIKDTLNGTRPTEPLFFRAKSGECIQFASTNLVPSNLNLDDFQIFSPTDVIGQHIHLVKFDVTSSDGSGNGWNYEDGTLAADEVRERITAYNKFSNRTVLKPKTHAMFKPGGAMAGDRRGYCSDMGGSDNDPIKHPWCGAQTTLQRWWADPLLNKRPGDAGAHDRTIRTVFTHDHFGPSSHQHHGLYSALVIEPPLSKWTFLDGKPMGGADANGKPSKLRSDGGPTSYAANVIAYTNHVTDKFENITCNTSDSTRVEQIKSEILRHRKDEIIQKCVDIHRNEQVVKLNFQETECRIECPVDEARTAREFNLAFADFAIVYDKNNRPINPPNRIDHDLPIPSIISSTPAPEGISASDPGTQLINYRNEPIPLRIGQQSSNGQYKQKVGNKEMCDVLKDIDTKSRCVGGDKKSCDAIAKAETKCDPGNVANVFSSKVHASQGNQGVLGKNGGKEIFTESLRHGLRHPGDPATPLLRAYAGDRVQIRLIQGAQEENHMFSMHGVKWLAEAESPNSGYVNGQPIGISEHFEFNVNIDTTDPKRNTDYLYSSWAADNLWDGQWGILRSYGLNNEDEAKEEKKLQLKRLPSNKKRAIPTLDSVKTVCPVDVPKRKITVEAGLVQKMIGGPLVYNSAGNIQDRFAIIFKRVEEVYDGTSHPDSNKADSIVCKEGVSGKSCSNKDNPEPLILRAKANDCIVLSLTNKLPPNKDMPDADINDPKAWSFNTLPPIIEGFNFNQMTSSSRISLHPQLLSVNVRQDDGSKVGFNDDSTVSEGRTIEYEWYAGNLVLDDNFHPKEAPVEFGIVGLKDMGDVIKHSSHGAIGALVVEPQCSQWKEDANTVASATVEHWEPIQQNDGKSICGSRPAKPQYFREFVLLYQDDLSLQRNGLPLPNLRNADDAEDTGQKAFNYRTEPIWARLGADPAVDPEQMLELDWSNVFSSYASNFRCNADPANGKFCDPHTPIFKAKVGENVRFRVAHVQGKPRNHGFALFGHDWQVNPWECSAQDLNSGRKDRCNSSKQGFNVLNSNYVGSTNGIGPSRHFNILTKAGGDFGVPGDYMYRTQEGFQFAAGLWGIFCVEGAGHSCENRGSQSMKQAAQ